MTSFSFINKKWTGRAAKERRSRASARSLASLFGWISPVPTKSLFQVWEMCAHQQTHEWAEGGCGGGGVRPPPAHCRCFQQRQGKNNLTSLEGLYFVSGRVPTESLLRSRRALACSLGSAGSGSSSCFWNTDGKPYNWRFRWSRAS
jgi:hypothetical protein